MGFWKLTGAVALGTLISYMIVTLPALVMIGVTLLEST